VQSYLSFAVAADADRSRNDAWPYQCQQGQGPTLTNHPPRIRLF